MDGQDARHAFAALAWRAVTSPVMAAGYVRCHPIISGASVARSYHDGSLTSTGELRTVQPKGLTQMHRWRSWPNESYEDEYAPVEPSEHAGPAFNAGFALTTGSVMFALPDLALPDPPPAPDSPALARTAAEAVGNLVGALNTVTPVIDNL